MMYSLVVLGLVASTQAFPTKNETEHLALRNFAAAFPEVSAADREVAVAKWLSAPLENKTAAPFRGQQWNCPSITPGPVATKISDLKITDVTAVGGVGDSVSTGCNAGSSSLLDMKDFPGISWVMGGDRFGTDTEPVTIGNILNHYNDMPSLSMGTGNGNMGSNYAVNGAVAQDVPSQVVRLETHFKNLLGKDYDSAWKLVNVFIGGNNVCKMCNGGADADRATTANYIKGVRDALNNLKAFPRTLVALVLLPDFTQLAKYNTGLGCGIALGVACPCASSSDDKIKDEVRARTAEYNDALRALVAEYSATDDFAIVMQPALMDAVIPRQEFMSAADCFHPSPLGQESFSIGLWNNLIAPAANKKTWEDGDTVVCPTADTKFHIN